MTDWLEELLELAVEEDQPEKVLSWGLAMRRRAAAGRDGDGNRINIRDRSREQNGWVAFRGRSAEDENGDTIDERRWEEIDRSAFYGGPQTEGGERQAAERDDLTAGAWIRGDAFRLESTDALQGGGRPDAAAESLYQRLIRAGRGTAASRPAERTVVVERQSTGTPNLTVDELDRAVRRDSRRYDGGMELY